MIYGSSCVKELYSIDKTACFPAHSRNSLSSEVQVILPAVFSSISARCHTSVCFELNIYHIFLVLDSYFVNPLPRRAQKLESVASVAADTWGLHTLTSNDVNEKELESINCASSSASHSDQTVVGSFVLAGHSSVASVVGAGLNLVEPLALVKALIKSLSLVEALIEAWLIKSPLSSLSSPHILKYLLYIYCVAKL